jgi:hypothetical protein
VPIFLSAFSPSFKLFFVYMVQDPDAIRKRIHAGQFFKTNKKISFGSEYFFLLILIWVGVLFLLILITGIQIFDDPPMLNIKNDAGAASRCGSGSGNKNDMAPCGPQR